MQKSKTFRPWQPEQTTLLPPSPREWLSADHQVYVLLDLVDELDLSQVLIPAQAKDPRGEKGEVGAFYWTALAPDIVNPGREEQDSVSV